MSYTDRIAQIAVRIRKAQQDETELATFLDLADAIRTGPPPGLAIELGHADGGTAWALGQTGYRVISVDPEPGQATEGNTLICGRSQDERIVHLVHAALAGFRADVLLIDGDHTEQGTARDWALYQHEVRAGGLIAIHDTERQDGPRALVAALRTVQPILTMCARPGDSPGYAFYRTP